MALRRNPASNWLRSANVPSRLFETTESDYELYEEDDEFVLTVELPGFDPADIDVSWNEGVLNVAAEHEDEKRDRQRTYHRRFRFPKDVDDEAIAAEYTNGILEVRLPVATGITRGKTIEVEG
ncbi:Hsp20/alpha crystallin family protein [Halostella sp. JP-L12]|uniref:Hsp20/alpha crystallin family protein n=1 Tax=Halostella TaxID=1843185 RepID=UPI000EF7EF91|nr:MULTISPECIES: Hsp20/alpha crystallin family protein [Halostella]NHN47142.1 Hsp20/alpha crystallin family protein [Halostella sp. JP-L12]